MEAEIRAALDRHRAASDADDFKAEHQIYLEDAVLEYPQSGERIRRRRNIQASPTAQPNGDAWGAEPRGAEGPVQRVLPEAIDPLGQRLRTPAERRVHRRFVSAHCVLAGHDAFGQGILVEVGAQARHGVREAAHVCADERPLFRPGQLFFSTLHGSKKLDPFWRSKAWDASAPSRMPGGPGRYRLPAARAAA
jgi:hypothetical protein